ncbi:YqhG family protein [Pullulanibacillus sp. KACC 23026]|uniref:YqhG family protein n=1 Tax=Pullulanibacillus sp. KACC 23026 TaxID=3028315 RepID=UPI0023AF7D06|nr:YqhG family protein [Pullulanibacillus sp. KACC 23026]WEG14295.1 YqhG family protein [Pullulanibacillus sp. KACC 23026]
MRQEAIHDYLETYFRASGCDILESRPHFLKVKLTVDMDKRLMNRPFYWHYVEKLGNQPETATLTLKTAFNGDEGELIHFGSPRLHQIFQSTKEMARYIRLYEEAPNSSQQKIGLVPWLCINTKISYCCDVKKDMLLSLGINLLNGMIVRDFHESMTKLSLTPKIPDFCYTMSPLIKPVSGLKRLEAIVEKLIQEEEHKWAEAAHKRWENDLDLLNRFYETIEEDEDPEQAKVNYDKEKEALRQQYEPHIRVSILNGGLFYLTPGQMGS